MQWSRFQPRVSQDGVVMIVFNSSFSVPRRISRIFNDSEKDFKEIRQNLNQLIGDAYDEMGINLHQRAFERIPGRKNSFWIVAFRSRLFFVLFLQTWSIIITVRLEMWYTVSNPHSQCELALILFPDQSLLEISSRLLGANSEDQLSQKLRCVYEESPQYSTLCLVQQPPKHPAVARGRFRNLSHTFRLIICGNPGTGKESVLMAYLIDQLLPLQIPSPMTSTPDWPQLVDILHPMNSCSIVSAAWTTVSKVAIRAPILKLRDDRSTAKSISGPLTSYWGRFFARWSPDGILTMRSCDGPLVHELRKSLLSHDMSPEQLMEHFIPLLKTYSKVLVWASITYILHHSDFFSALFRFSNHHRRFGSVSWTCSLYFSITRTSPWIVQNYSVESGWQLCWRSRQRVASSSARWRRHNTRQPLSIHHMAAFSGGRHILSQSGKSKFEGSLG